VPDGVTTLNKKSTNVDDLMAFWRANPVQAALDIFGATDPDFDLDMAQRLVLKSRWTHNFEIDIFTRGGGKTFMDALTGSLQALLYPGQRIGFIAPSFRQSKMMWQELEKLVEISPVFQESVAHGPSTTPEKCWLKLKSAPGKVGSVIEALPMGVDGSKIRGARYFYVLADELAQINKDVLDIVVGGFLATKQNPMKQVKKTRRLNALLAAGKITRQQYDQEMGTGNVFIGSSTAFYQYNHLWERVQNLIEQIWAEKQRLIRRGLPHEHLVAKGGPLNQGQIPARYLSDGKNALCAFAWWDMSEGFMDMPTIRRQRQTMSDYQFLMEFCCYFPPDSEGFFRRSLLDAARAHNSFGPALYPRQGVDYVMGIDPARSGDNLAISLYEVDFDLRLIRLVRVFTYNNEPFPKVHQEIRKIIRQFQVRWIKMDAGGGGTTLRDLLADQRSCPPGEKLILEKDNDDHRALTGERLLAPLVQFSCYDWVRDTNEALRSALEHGRMQIAAIPPVPGELYVPEMDDLDLEMEKMLTEVSSIVTTAVGNRLRWDTPTKQQRKDRYSAVLIGYDAAQEWLDSKHKPQELPDGAWG